VTGAGLGRTQCRCGLGERDGRVRARSLGMRGGGGQDFSNSCGSEAGGDKKVQPAQDLVHGQRKVGNPRSIWIGFLFKADLFRTDHSKQTTFITGLLWTRLLWTWSLMNVVCY